MFKKVSIKDLFEKDSAHPEEAKGHIGADPGIHRNRTLEQYFKLFDIKNILYNKQKDIRWADMGGGTGIALIQAMKKLPKWFKWIRPKMNDLRIINVDLFVNTEYKNSVYFIKGDITTIKLKEKQDLITAFEVLQYVTPDEVKTIKHWYSLLKPGGVLKIGFDVSVEAANDLKGWLKESGLSGEVKRDCLTIKKP